MMISPMPAPSAGKTASPTPSSGSQSSPVSGNSPSAPAPGQEVERFNIEESEPTTQESTEQDPDSSLAELREQLKDDPAAQQWLEEAIEALPAALDPENPAPERLMEALAQLSQRQPDNPAMAQALQQFFSALQTKLASAPGGDQLVAGLRSLQNIRPMAMTNGNQLLAPHQVEKAANGAQLGQLQALAQLTQPQNEASFQLLPMRSADSEQLTELTNLALLRQTQPQLPPQSGSLNTLAPSGAGTHEFSALPLGKHAAHWAEQMLTPLTDRLRVQSHMDIKQATLRLDPPELGKLDLQVRTEGDRVFIQISATNPMVRDQLLQLADRLRQDLMLGEAYTQVNVDIGQPGDQAGDGRPAASLGEEIAQAIDGHEESQDVRPLSLTADRNGVDLYV